MKITFEGQTLKEIYREIDILRTAIYRQLVEEAAEQKTTNEALSKMPDPLREPWPKTQPKAVENPVDIFADIQGKTPVEKPKRVRTEKQKANDEKMRVAALEKIAAKKAAKAAAAMPPPERPTPPPPKSAEGMDPAEVVKMREKTLEELREAYGNGFDKEVLELLSRFGNGAKSFRELPPESFVPIREAIDNGALT